MKSCSRGQRLNFKTDQPKQPAINSIYNGEMDYDENKPNSANVNLLETNCKGQSKDTTRIVIRIARDLAVSYGHWASKGAYKVVVLKIQGF